MNISEFTLKTCPYVPLPTTSISSNIPAGSCYTDNECENFALGEELWLQFTNLSAVTKIKPNDCLQLQYTGRFTVRKTSNSAAQFLACRVTQFLLCLGGSD